MSGVLCFYEKWQISSLHTSTLHLKYVMTSWTESHLSIGLTVLFIGQATISSLSLSYSIAVAVAVLICL